MDLLKRLFGTDITSIEPAEAHTRLQKKPVPYLLDVRQPAEFRKLHVVGAKLIPLNELPNKLKSLPKNREILCICTSGSRSSSATRQLAGLGYTVVNVRGGLNGWQRAGLPVKRA